MKKYYILFLLPLVILAQNPDGETASLHITPMLLSGTYNQYQYNSLGQIYDIAEKDFETSYYVDVMLKLPLSEHFTLSPIFNYAVIKRNEDIQTKLTNFGARFSLYFD